MTKEKKKIADESLTIPQGVSVEIRPGGMVSVKGPGGEVVKKLLHSSIALDVKDGVVVLHSSRSTKREKTMLGTFKSHLANMFAGAVSGHTYKLKICSSHFPLNVAMNGNAVVIKNLFGEKVARQVIVPANVKISIQGQDITVSSPDKEAAGQCALAIERRAQRTSFDRRIFQDGVYIVEKA